MGNLYGLVLARHARFPDIKAKGTEPSRGGEGGATGAQLSPGYKMAAVCKRIRMSRPEHDSNLAAIRCDEFTGRHLL
jgi:hypothetical protein